MIPPRATYRLQLSKDFTLADATALVPYLETLGVSHAYLSPVLKARSGSSHFYDTVDHGEIDPVLGTIAEFRALARALQARGMGIVLDFVPNHMGIGGAENALWLDVLRHGQASRYADWFDIDWRPPRPGMDGKVLAPILGKPYAEVLADGDIGLKADGDGFAIWVYGTEKLPVRPEDCADLLARFGTAAAAVAAHATPMALDRLIARQHWRLAHFSTGASEINYRRFFIHSDLVGIRIERPDVFEHAHRLIFALIAEGLVEGLRIDHVDGLADPAGYLQRLRAAVPRPIYLIVEKIVAPHETIPSDWPIEGMTGYEAGAALARVLTQERGQEAITAAYRDAVGETCPVREEIFRCKRRVLDNELAAEMGALARLSARLAWSVPASADLTESDLHRAWREIISQLEVYRTYIRPETADTRAGREFGIALARARRRQAQIQPAVFDFIEALVCGGLGPDYSTPHARAMVRRFQQLSGPAMAKGLEDTALYRYNRLLSLNEVGARPDRFSMSIAAFHDSNRRRLAAHPHAMLTTSTHDTKLGEDSRMRIAALGDDPLLWRGAVAAWRSILEASARGVHPNDLYRFFQLLLGGWPIAGDVAGFSERLTAAMMKSLREARQRSDWNVNNGPYEAGVRHLVHSALENAEFLESFHAVRGRFEAIGRRKSLIQVALKLTIPGVPDIYRGAEDWEQSFVDPDNRRPVDFAVLWRRLGEPEAGGNEKLVLTQRLLHLRRENAELFAGGSYEPLDRGADVLAFRRQAGASRLLVLADLSPGHARGFTATEMPGLTVAGSQQGPFWVVFEGGAPAAFR